MSKDSKKETLKKPKSKIRKIFSWITTGIFTAILAVLATFQIAGMVNQTTYQDNIKIKNYFGYHVMEVLTDSMEPLYPVGSTIVVKTIDDPSTIKVGDNVTFLYELISSNPGKEIVTHQISEITPPTNEDSNYHFVAHGINTESDQCQVGGKPGDCTGQTQTFTQEDLIGVVVGRSKALGFLFNFLTKWYGMLIVLLIPTIYLIVTSIIDIVKACKEDDDDDSKDDTNSGGGSALKDLSPEEKEKLKQQLIAKILQEKKVKNNDA